jgi:hypothetical protein
MVRMPMAYQDEIGFDTIDIDRFSQLVMRNKGVKQEFFPVYLNAKA